jgi:TonB family protein
MLASVLALAASAACGEGPSTTTSGAVAVTIDAAGKPVGIEPDPALGAELGAFLRDTIAGWEFVPAQLNGRPAAARTTVTVRMRASPAEGRNRVALQIIGAGTGPGYASTSAPKYPDLALRRSLVGEVIMQVQIGSDGRVSAAEVKRSNAHQVLQSAALAAVKRWTFHPEQVEGVSLATTALVPIRFCLSERRCPSLDGGDVADAPQAAPVAESVTSIRNGLVAR